MTESNQNPQLEASKGKRDGTRNNLSRRKMLQALGSSAVLGIGISQFSASATAESRQDSNKITTSPLSNRKMGQLRGKVMSSAAFKAVRQEIRNRGYSPQFGETAVGKKVTNTETGRSWSIFKVECTPNNPPKSNQNAILYAKKKSSEIYVRGIYQRESEPIKMIDCSAPVAQNGAANEEQLVTYSIAVNNRACPRNTDREIRFHGC